MTGAGQEKQQGKGEKGVQCLPCAFAQAFELGYSFVMRSFKSVLKDARGPEAVQCLPGFAFFAGSLQEFRGHQ